MICPYTLITIKCIMFMYVQNGQTALLLACWKGHLPAVRLLLQKHANVSICSKVCVTCRKVCGMQHIDNFRFFNKSLYSVTWRYDCRML